MRRLYLKVYLSFLGILLLFGALVVGTWWTFDRPDHDPDWRQGLAELAAEILPGADAPVAELRAVLDRLHNQFTIDLAVIGEDGRLIAAAGDKWRRIEPAKLTHQRGVLTLPDGRRLVISPGNRPRLRWLGLLGLLAIALAVGAYPLARQITGRLERLQTRVDQLGAGDLSARVSVEGKDEVADLAHSFNRAAERIERLVSGQRSMLAAASHELRSPLARIRMAVELLETGDRPELREQLERDIAELDDLIDDVLLSSRLQALDELGRREPVDLLALVAEEAARVGADATGTAVTLDGDPRLLRRLVRNLLENARRHGKGASITARVDPVDGGARIRIEDDGPGVPEAERDRIFEPFYRPAGMSEGKDRGVGLGLSLVREIARRHGGDATCTARPGGGSRFEITLSREPES